MIQLAVRGDETLGEARFVRNAEGDAAEPAFAVADTAQGLGLGRILIARLAAAARERGIPRFSPALARTACRGPAVSA